MWMVADFVAVWVMVISETTVNPWYVNTSATQVVKVDCRSVPTFEFAPAKRDAVFYLAF